MHRCNNCTQYSTGTNRLYRELRMARLPAECLLSDILTKWGGVMFRLDGCMAQSGNWSCMQRKRELRTTCLVYLVDHSHTLRNCSHFKTKFSFYPHLWPKLVHIMIKTLLTILSLYICNNSSFLLFLLGWKIWKQSRKHCTQPTTNNNLYLYQQRFIANADFSSSHEQHEHTDFPISPS